MPVVNESNRLTSGGLRGVLAQYMDLRAASVLPLGRLTGEQDGTWITGATGARLVLHRLPGWLSEKHARFATAVHEHAARAGLAPSLLRNSTTGTLTSHCGQFFQLMRYVEGTRNALSVLDPGDCAELGRMLGLLHEVLASFPATADAPGTVLSGDPAAPLRAAYAAHQHGACPHSEVRKALAEKIRRANSLPPALFNDLASLPRQVIHGDIHPGNVLLGRGHGRVAAFIDFDLARYAPSAYEVMRALIYCIMPAGPAARSTPRAAAFLRAYLATRPLSDHEIGTMVPLYEAVQILDPHGLDVCAGASEAALRFGQARFALLYWLRRNGPVIASLAREAAPPRRGE